MRKLVAILFLHIGIAAVATPPGQSFNFIPFGKAEGLKHSQILDIAPDRNGNMWLCTAAPSLYRFDGKAFTEIKIRLPEFQGTISTFKVFPDSRNRVWIVTNIGLLLFNQSTSTAIEVDGNPALGTSCQLFVDWNDSPWVIDEKGEVFSIQDNVLATANDINASLDGPALGYFWNEQNQVCFYTSSGNVIALDAGGNVTQHVAGNKSNPSTMVITKNGDDHLIARTDGLWKGSLDQLTKIDVEPSMDFQGINQAAIDRDGLIWILKSHEVFVIDQENKVHHINEESNLSKNRVNLFLLDHNREVWLSVDVAGILKFREQPWQKVEGTVGKDITAIVQRTNDQKIVFGTYNHGILGYKSPVLDGTAITSMLPKPNGSLLASTLQGGLYEVSTNGVEEIIGPGESKQSLLGILEHSNSIMVGGDFNIFTVEKGQPTRKLNEGGFSGFVINDTVYYSGLKTGVHKIISESEITGGPAELKPLTVFKVKQLPWGEFLAWGEFPKLLFYDSLFRQTRSVDVSKWTTNVLSVELLDRHRAIVGSNDGLFDVTFLNDTATKVRSYGKVDGYQGDEFYATASLIADDGKVYMGTVDGAYRYDPRDDHDESYVPFVYLTNVEFRTTNKVEFEDGYFPIPKRLMLSHDENLITFSFDASSLSDPHSLNFQYQLSEIDKQWTQPNASRKVTYSNLPPGTYTFSVQAVNPNEILSAIATFSFSVTPAFWQASWFYFASLVVVVSLIFAVIAISSAYRLRKHKLQEEMRAAESARLRKQMSMDFHDEMGNKLAGMLTQASLLKEKNAGTDSAAVFEYFEKTAYAIYQGTRDFIWTIDVKSNQLKEVISYLHDFGSNLFERNDIAFHVESSILDSKYNWRYMDGINRNIVLIFKEAMTNALKHSGSRNVYFNVELAGDDIIISFKDDGRGITNTGKPGSGLVNMENRAKKIHAQFLITSEDKKGTRVQLTLKKPRT